MENKTLKFCQQAVRSGFLTKEAARRAVEAHRKYADAGKPKSIESICAASGLMTAEQIRLTRSRMEGAPPARAQSPPKTDPDKAARSTDQRLKGAPEIQWIKTIQIQTRPDQTIKLETDEKPPQGREVLSINSRSVGLEKSGKKASRDFTILNRIGKGGMAVVCAARQNALNRDIAFKMMRKEKKGKPDARHKFIAEAVVTGNLDHPHIVPVHDLGRSKSGDLFYTMKNVTGASWDQVMDQTPLSENLEILFKVCDAVAFAHDRGIIHRDLKPANVMVGEFGEVYVMDWGLAAGVEENRIADPVGSNAGLAGTPAYMAPEMAKRRGDLIGIHSDVYLLGGILYEIRTGKRPHEGEDVFACILDAMNNGIRVPENPDELTRIALKAMATEPWDRYPSVKLFKQAILDFRSHTQSIALAEKAGADLKLAQKNRDYDGFALSLFGFREALELWPDNKTAETGISKASLAYASLAHEKGDLDLALSLLRKDDPSHTDLIKNVSADKRLRENRRKRLRRMTYGAAAMAVAAIVILTTAVIWVNAEKERALRAEKEARRAQLSEIAHRKKAEQENYLNLIALAERKIRDYSMDQAKTLLASTIPEMRGWEWFRLTKLCSLDLMTLKGHTDHLACVAFSPDGKWAATGALDGFARVWDLSSGRQKAKLAVPGHPVTRVWFSKDSASVHTAGEQGPASAWDVMTGQLLASDTVPGETAFSSTAVSPDGKSMVITKRGRDARVVTLPDGLLITVLKGHKARVSAAAYSPDGLRIVTGSGDNTARIWDANTGKQLLTLAGHSQAVTAVAFSADGGRVITGSWDKTAKIWDADGSRDTVVLKGHRNYIHDLAFSPKGDRILTAGRDGVAILWDTATGKQITRLADGGSHVLCADISPDGTKALTGGHDNQIRLWDLPGGQKVKILSGHTHSVMSVAFSPDGKQAVSAGWDGTARIWDLDSGKLARTLSGHQGPVLSAAFSPDAKTVATSGKDGIIRLWNPSTGAVKKKLTGHQNAVYGIAFSPASFSLASVSWDGTARIWDLGKDSPPRVLTGHSGAVHAVCYSPDGKRLVTGGWDATVRIWDVAAGRELITLLGHTEAVFSVAFSRDGKQVASGGRDKTGRIYKAMFASQGYP